MSKTNPGARNATISGQREIVAAIASLPMEGEDDAYQRGFRDALADLTCLLDNGKLLTAESLELIKQQITSGKVV